MAGTNRIVKLGLEARANALRSSIEPQYSVRDIARILTEESGKTIKFQSVQRYFDALSRPPAAPVVAVTPVGVSQQQDPTAVREQRQAEIRDAAARGRLDAVQQLRDVNTETRAILDSLKDQQGKFVGGVSGGYLALAAITRIESQLLLQAKLLGDLPDQPQVNITIVENQFKEFKAAVLGVMCPECQRRLAEQLRSIVGK
ncbi:hypothetical protein [Methanoregula sp.]|uniref:hypothetical protein n=1 Tax=Methanoregula sp. TaxID=2052170 RepID=UPI00261C35C0|nr:hypothetical protein [Methanoregula sp.]MDD5144504.1 hypothetical protein [Methanoregula sp.]